MAKQAKQTIKQFKKNKKDKSNNNPIDSPYAVLLVLLCQWEGNQPYPPPHANGNRLGTLSLFSASHHGQTWNMEKQLALELPQRMS